MKKLVFAMAFCKLIVGNFGAKVVYMVKADVTGEPLEHSRQLKEGASL